MNSNNKYGVTDVTMSPVTIAGENLKKKTSLSIIFHREKWFKSVPMLSVATFQPNKNVLKIDFLNCLTFFGYRFIALLCGFSVGTDRNENVCK